MRAARREWLASPGRLRAAVIRPSPEGDGADYAAELRFWLIPHSRA